MRVEIKIKYIDGDSTSSLMEIGNASAKDLVETAQGQINRGFEMIHFTNIHNTEIAVMVRNIKEITYRDIEPMPAKKLMTTAEWIEKELSFESYNELTEAIAKDALEHGEDNSDWPDYEQWVKNIREEVEQEAAAKKEKGDLL